MLALVIEQPSHGYEISRRYERRFGSFAPLSVPRVYSALDRLRDSGMIEPVALKPAEPAGRQHLMRRSYRATRSGTQAYRRWVAERMHDDPRRAELLGRIASVGLLGIDAVLDVIEEYERSCVEELRSLPSGKDRPDGPADLHELTESLVLDQQRRELRARYEWAVHARQLLEAHRQKAPSPAGSEQAREEPTA